MKKFELAQYSGMVRKSDLSREMALRNANAHKRLEGQLRHLDGQLHQRLVSVQADIVDLKLSQYSSGIQRSKSPARRPLGRNNSGNPDSANTNGLKHGANARQLPVINVQSDTDTDSRSLPQIHQGLTNSSGNLGKESRLTAHSFYSLKGQSRPSTSASSRHEDLPVGKKSNYGSSLSVSSNLYRPRSSPDLRSCSGLDGRASPSFGRRKLPPLERSDSDHEARLHHSSDYSSVGLSERVKDFVKRPNTSSGERESIYTNVSKSNFSETSVNQTTALLSDCSGKEPTAVPENKETQSKSSAEAEKTSEDKEKSFTLSDEDLFLNSNLLKAHSDAPLSASLPDLASLGFMDYNEVIDKRLRDLQEWQHNPPTEEEMKKVKYLRLKNQPQTPDILSVFDKE